MLLLLKRCSLITIAGLLAWTYSTAVTKHKSFLVAPDFSDGAWLIKQGIVSIIPVPTLSQINRPLAKKTTYAPQYEDAEPFLPSPSENKSTRSCKGDGTFESHELYTVLVRLKTTALTPISKADITESLGKPTCTKKKLGKEKLIFVPKDEDWQFVVYTENNKITHYERQQ